MLLLYSLNNPLVLNPNAFAKNVVNSQPIKQQVSTNKNLVVQAQMNMFQTPIAKNNSVAANSFPIRVV